MPTSNKILLTLIGLIFVDIFIIVSVLVKNHSYKPPNTYAYTKTVINHPKIGFAEIIAMTHPQSQVLSASTEVAPSPTPGPALSKNKYTIAVIGDSMEETMGDNLDYLQTSLKEKYPQTQFSMYNYGIGSEKVSVGLERLNKSFDHTSRHYPALTDLKPDILIIGSYAYNPFNTHDKTRHYNALSELINEARNISKVYMLAEIAPIEEGFGTGPGGVNWPRELIKPHVQKIQEQMQNTIEISRKLTVPLIDVYNRSKKPNSIYGEPKYVSTHDHIHPSILGQTFTADIVAGSIELR